MSEYARGGLIPGTPQPMTVERLGYSAEVGCCLYSIDGGPPERIITADQVRRFADTSRLLAVLNKSKDGG